MCTNKKTYVTRASILDLNRAQPLLVLPECGHCPECRKRRSLELSLRTYYETLDVFEKFPNASVYFDTLTYDENHVPYVSNFFRKGSVPPFLDFRCFNYHHIRKTFARLRKKGAAFRYFLTSEYGSSDTGTHRPHYHILFFLLNITPRDFAILLHQCWPYGLTDAAMHGFSQAYIDKHSVKDNDKASVISVANYITKYVTKQSHFELVNKKRIDSLCSRLTEADLLPSYPLVHDSLKSTILHYTQPFQRRSLHFGEAALKYLDYSSGTIPLPQRDKSKPVLQVPIPLYLARKKFYSIGVDVDDRKHWMLNSDGVTFYTRLALKKVQTLSSYLTDFVSNPKQAYDTAVYMLFVRNRFFSPRLWQEVQDMLENGDTLVRALIKVNYRIPFICQVSIDDDPFLNEVHYWSFSKEPTAIPFHLPEISPFRQMNYIQQYFSVEEHIASAYDKWKKSQHKDALELYELSIRLEDIYKPLN